jgi:lipopolysaccharide biosynthesis regulator YciM
LHPALGILDRDEFSFNQLVSKASLASCAAKQLCITAPEVL